MNAYRLLLASVVAVCSVVGCASVEHGNYVLRMKSVSETQVEIGGLLHVSAFIDWKDTEYGAEPRTLVEMLVRREFDKLGYSAVSVQTLRMRNMQNNYIAYSATVTLRNAPISALSQETRGDFPVKSKTGGPPRQP